MGLSWDLNQTSQRPYFLWDEDMTIAGFKAEIASTGPRHFYYIGKLLREAACDEAWKFITPQDVADSWAQIEPFLGRRREFWEFLLTRWRHARLIH